MQTKENAIKSFENMKRNMSKTIIELEKALRRAKDIDNCPYHVEDNIEAAHKYLRLADRYFTTWYQWDSE